MVLKVSYRTYNKIYGSFVLLETNKYETQFAPTKGKLNLQIENKIKHEKKIDFQNNLLFFLHLH